MFGRTIINNATQADGMVKEKMSTHMAGMQVWGWFIKPLIYGLVNW